MLPELRLEEMKQKFALFEAGRIFPDEDQKIRFDLKKEKGNGHKTVLINRLQ